MGRLLKIFLLLMIASLPVSIVLYFLQGNSQEIRNVALKTELHKQWSIVKDSKESTFKFLDPAALERQTARKALVRQYCSYKGTKGEFLTKTAKHTLAVRVIPSRKLIYCIIPKCASRQIRGLLYNLNHSLVRHAHKIPPEDLYILMNTYFKVVFVREPFERLLSAYKDKFVYPRENDKKLRTFHGREILNRFRPNATERSLERLDDISFREFIQYLVTNGSNETTKVMDWHWNNYNNLCHMCSIDYDFIGHYETLAEDFMAFEKALGMRFTIGIDNGLHVHHSNTSSELLKYYSQIPLQWIKKLGVIYNSSFEMFNYSFPGPLKSLFQRQRQSNSV